MKLIQPIFHSKLQLPLYDSKVQAGFPSPAEGGTSSKLDLNEHLIDHPAATFFVRVAGESMIEAGIFENDILVVDRSLTPMDGKIVVAVIGNEFTVKRLKYVKGKAILVAANKDYPPIIIDINSKDGNNAEAYIWGVVTSVVRKL